MGGQYYPGKDKKRNALRRKTLWYRIFCSSRYRRIGTMLVVSYCIVFFGIVPALGVISNYGDMLSKRVDADGGPMGPRKKVGAMVNEVKNKVKDKVKNIPRKQVDAIVNGVKKKVKDKVENIRNQYRPGNNEGPKLYKPATAIITKELEEREQNDDHDFEEEGEVEIMDDDVKIKSKEFIKNIKPMDMLRQDAHLLNQKLDELEEHEHDSNYSDSAESGNDKNDILKQIVPTFHDAAVGAASMAENEKEREEQKGEKSNGEGEMNDLKITIMDAMAKDTNKSNNSSKNEIVERTLLNQNIHYQSSSCPKDGVENTSISLVIQTTFDRFKLLGLTCQRWGKSSPIIVSVYLSQEEYDNEWNSQILEYTTKDHNNNITCNRGTTIFIPYISKSDEERTLRYPINALRNKALDRVTTSHVLVIDIDMIPSQDLDQEILKSIDLAIERRQDDDGDSGIDPRDAIVIPAFERRLLESEGDKKCKTLEECQEIMKQDKQFIPGNIQELKGKIVKDQCAVFQSNNNWEGHSSTDTSKWIKSSYDTSSSSSSKLRVLDCFQSLRYEPYVVIPWCALKSNAEKMIIKRPGPKSPYYDERFFGYGKNKIQQIAHLRRRGYQFMVMPPTGFITHFPHPISSTKKTWNDRESFDLHAKMDKLYPRYLKELEEVYEHANVKTKLCKRKKK